MKKLFYSIVALAIAGLSFTSCEDVPMPYDMTIEEHGGTNPAEMVAKGSGTAADPFNIVAAQNFINAGQNLDQVVYVKGIISSIKEIDSSNFGNATYYISDDGSRNNQFYVYRGYSLGNKKFKSADEIKKGDEVIVCGKLVNFKGTKEFTQGNYIYSLNGKTEGGTGGTTTVTPTGEGTEASPYNVAKAHEVIKTATLPTEEVFVSGIISEIKSVETATYGSAEYYISDNGKTDGQLYIFHGKYLNGQKFTSAEQIKVGDKVVVKGKLDNYKGNSPQVAYGVLVSLNNQGGSTPTKVGLNAPFDKDMAGFTIENISVPAELGKVWALDTKYANMKATAAKKDASGAYYVKHAAKSRLVSPAFSLAGLSKATLSFQHCGKYFGKIEDECKVFASEDGKNWKEIAIATYPAPDFKFVDTTCDLTAYAGKSKVYISFLYTSTTDAAPTWEVKNVVVK